MFGTHWLGSLAQSSPEIDLDEVVGEGLRTQDYLLAAGLLLGAIILAEVAGWLLHRQMTRNDDARLAFAAQPILENAFASTVLRRRKHFARGDQISIDDTAGTVLDVNLRNVVLRSYDGERLTVPCGVVVKSRVIDHTILGPRRTTLRVGVHYRTELERVREVLLEAVSSVDDVRRDPPSEVWVVGFFESSIDLDVRFWTAPDIASVYRVRNHVAIAVKRALDDAGIEIPFPQREVRMISGEVADSSSRGLPHASTSISSSSRSSSSGSCSPKNPESRSSPNA